MFHLVYGLSTNWVLNDKDDDDDDDDDLPAPSASCLLTKN